MSQHRHTHQSRQLRKAAIRQRQSHTLTLSHNELGILTMAIQAWADTLAECTEDQHLRQSDPEVHFQYTVDSVIAEALFERLSAECLKTL